MGVGDIVQALRPRYPQYLDFKEIAKITKISERNTLKVLSKMRKRGEVEYIIIKSDARNGVWIIKYRIRRK